MQDCTSFWKGYDETQVLLMQEMVISVDEQDNVLGPISKHECHLRANIDKGMLHRAFSVLLFNENNEFLLTQRSDKKIVFPEYFTNSCCSHPLHTPLEMDTNEAMGPKRDAQRKLEYELGIDPSQLSMSYFQYMTRMIYRSSCSSIWSEAEITYICTVRKNVNVNRRIYVNPNEVKGANYLTDFKAFIEANEAKVSPWFKIMVNEYLYDWWENLSDLSKFADHSKVHCYL